jgi:DNA-binding MarR family transcriptional regulator
VKVPVKPPEVDQKRAGKPSGEATFHEVPLARLCAMAFRTLIDDLHDRLRGKGYREIRPVLGFVLLAARERPVSGKEVAQLTGVTKQAAAKLLAGMVEEGYLRATAATQDARWRPLRITPRGRRLLAVVEEIYAELEGEWAKAIGKGQLRTLKLGLTQALLKRHGGELPPVKPT